MPDNITITALARELDMDKSALRKAVVKMGLSTRRVRTKESSGQAMLALTPEDAKRVRAYYAWRLDG